MWDGNGSNLFNSNMKKIYKLKGMHCNSCSNLIENKLEKKVNSISVNYSTEEAEIDFDENKINEKEIFSEIKSPFRLVM